MTSTSVAARERTLEDREARRRVSASLGDTLFVEAGAGSGKTSSLVERIVNLVANGAPVSRLAAITFTEAAARELRTRVRDELERQGTERGDRQLLNAAGQVESAAFTTLHGFALRLLADHPVEAGLPPGFAVADEIGSMLEFQESWRSFAAQIGDDLDLLDLLERAAALQVELRHFLDVARRFDDNWDLLTGLGPPPELSPLEPAPAVAAIEALGSLADHCLDRSDHLAAALIGLAASAREVGARDPLTQLAWLDRAAPWPRRNVGRKAAWVHLDVDEVRRRVADVQDATGAAVARYRHEVIGQMVARVAAFVDQRVEARQARGELAFHDLLVLARTLLRRNPLVREELHQRYSRILLDEFQDTDPIQIELAVLLGADGLVGDRPWPELAAGLEPGRLVVVGDPKQSIYRFRRADMAVYAEAERSLATEPVRLTTNFRSVPGVVALVNGLFEVLMGEGEPGAQPRFVPLVPFRHPDPETDVPVLVLGQVHERTVPVGEIRELEAADVAAVICRAMEEGWRCERDGQWRPLRLQDIAVLIPSRLSLPALEAAFGAANVPFRPETSSLVYATQEVRDVLAGVRAVVDPTSSIDVVAALRSALFALGDDDLLSWHQAGGTFDYQHLDATVLAPELADHPVLEAFTVLARWHRDRWWVEPSNLIERIVRERRLREAALAEPRPRDRWRRYRFLAEQAREFTATRGGDLQDFVAWVEVQASDLARVTEPIPPEPDDDAVRVLTIHGSKGLEFPMVIVAGAPTRDSNRSSGPQVLFPPGGPPEVKVGKDRTTANFDVHASVEEVLDRHERIRLHYVAATRARDLLVLSAHHRQGLQSSGQRTWQALERCEGLWRRFERRGDERYLIEPPTQLRLSSGSYRETEAGWRDEQQRLLAGNERFRTLSATAVAARLDPVRPGGSAPIVMVPGGAIQLTSARAVGAEPAEVTGHELHPVGHPVPPPPGGEPEADGDGLASIDAATPGPVRPGTAIGIAVHATLQHADLHASDADLALGAARAAAQAGIPDLAAEVARLAGVALRSPVMDLARSHRHWRELYVAAPVAEGLVEGFVDLCVETPDGLIVVDYKTDRVSGPDEVEAKVGHYRWQGAAYALALEQVTGRPVIECRFLFLADGDQAIERSAPDLDGAVARVRELLAGKSQDGSPGGS